MYEEPPEQDALYEEPPVVSAAVEQGCEGHVPDTLLCGSLRVRL